MFFVMATPEVYRAAHHRDAFAGFSRHFVDFSTSGPDKVVWIHKRHCPDDPRSVFPVRRQKPQKHECPSPRPLPEYWLQQPEPQIGTFSRSAEETLHYRSCQGTRCEEWSSIREMLPSSRGFPLRHLQQHWGTIESVPPHYTSRRLAKFPHFNNTTTV